MDERGGNLSDTSPIIRIKAAIKKLMEELKDMEVQIGVVSHTLMQVGATGHCQGGARPGRTHSCVWVACLSLWPMRALVQLARIWCVYRDMQLGYNPFSLLL